MIRPVPVNLIPPPEAEDAARGTGLYQRWILRELELLVSAGLVFALFQLPGLLDQAIDRVDPHLGGNVHLMVFMGYYVATLIAYALIAIITTHFLLRAFGIALLGMEYLFPAGIDWEKLKVGPLVIEFAERRLPSLGGLEERVDRLASALFGFLFLFLTMMLMILVWLVMGALGALLWAAVSPRHTFFEILPEAAMIAFGVVIVIQILAFGTDKLLRRERWRRPWLARLGRRMLAVQHAVTLGSLPSLLTWHFASRLSRSRMTGIILGFTYSLIGLFMIVTFARLGVLGFDSYLYYPPQVEAGAQQAQYYDNLRPAGTPVRFPTLDSDVVTGPYLRLFVPYDAREDNERIAALCPELAPLHAPGPFKRRREPADAATLARVSACLDRVYEIELDGEPLDGADFVFYRHPDGVAGRLAHLPTAALAPGRHDLVVRHAPLPGKTAEEDEDADLYYLPFWK